MAVNNRVTVDESSCVGCGVCVEICPTDVLRQEPSNGTASVAYKSDCQGCFLCVIDCPFQAISVTVELDEQERMRLARFQTTAPPLDVGVDKVRFDPGALGIWVRS